MSRKTEAPTTAEIKKMLDAYLDTSEEDKKILYGFALGVSAASKLLSQPDENSKSA